MILSISPVQSVKGPSMHAGIGYYTRVTIATNGFNFQIINSLLESMGVTLDCNVLSYNETFPQAISGLPQATSVKRGKLKLTV